MQVMKVIKATYNTMTISFHLSQKNAETLAYQGKKIFQHVGIMSVTWPIFAAVYGDFSTSKHYQL